MLANTLTVNGKTLTKIKEEGYTSEYYFRDATEMYTLQVRHQKTKAKGDVPVKDRHNVELVITTFATAEAAEIVEKTYLVVEQMPNNSTITLPTALMSALTASTNALITSVIGWES